jgi:hypothetical protein
MFAGNPYNSIFSLCVSKLSNNLTTKQPVLGARIQIIQISLAKKVMRWDYHSLEV